MGWLGGSDVVAQCSALQDAVPHRLRLRFVCLPLIVFGIAEIVEVHWHLTVEFLRAPNSLLVALVIGIYDPVAALRHQVRLVLPRDSRHDFQVWVDLWRI